MVFCVNCQALLGSLDMSAGICEVKNSHCGPAESSSSLGYDTVSLCCLTVTMKARHSLETSVITRPTTWRHIPDNWNLRNYHTSHLINDFRPSLWLEESLLHDAL